MFYVYRRDHYAEYEPAEGGYYVDCSEISEVDTYWYLEDAFDAPWHYGFHIDGGNGKTMMWWPVFRYDYHGNIGDGFELGISVDEPRDEPYRGYC